MTECFMCGKSLENASNNRGRHDVCFKLQRERYDDGSCLSCGKKQIAVEKWCMDCTVNDRLYQNYPGPQ